MNQDLALRVLGHIMNWSDDRARREFGWLKLMARLKFDGYRDFRAGMRFTESLSTWLQQFTPQKREAAYAFIRNTLVYIGPSEMEKLVTQFYPRTVTDRLLRTAAKQCSIPFHRVLRDPDGRDATDRLRRQTLFMGLSDGARIDTIRHANAAHLSNEQVVLGTQVDTEKWQDLLETLREDLDDAEARFRLVYLVDDFTASGTSFLRRNNGTWKGKLPRFRESVAQANESLCDDTLFDDAWELCIHHYVASTTAATAIQERLRASSEVFPENWASRTHLTFGMVLPADLPINTVPGHHEAFLELTQLYYDPSIETKHTAVGGVEHLGLGYGGCALPLVLEHNTPNNAVALLWAETDGDAATGTPAMRPLFRRRQRHT